MIADGALATVIDNLAIDNAVVAFGEQAPAYYAQSFVAVGNLETVTFLAASASGPDDTDFRVLITETNGGTGAGIHPTNVLFESATLTVPFDPTFPINRLEFTQFDINAGGLALSPGTTYTIVLDAFVAYDGIEGSAGSAQNRNYADGHFFHYGGSVAVGDRTTHFLDVANWVDGRVDDDLAFRLVFSIPAPTTLALFGLGLIGLGFARRRRTSRRSE